MNKIVMICTVHPLIIFTQGIGDRVFFFSMGRDWGGGGFLLGIKTDNYF